MYCGNCGKAIPDGKRFCSICGAGVGKGIKFCAKTGIAHNPAKRFCSVCGVNTEALAPVVQPTNPQPVRPPVIVDPPKPPVTIVKSRSKVKGRRYSTTVGDKGKVTVPKQVREARGIEAGKTIVFVLTQNGDILVEIP